MFPEKIGGRLMNREDTLEELRAKIIDDTGVPETVRRFLGEGADLEEIRLDAHGSWWHEGDIFENERLSLLFHRSLHRTARGNWVLEVKPYTYPVLVDLCGTFVVRIIESNGDMATVRLADRSVATLNLGAIYTDGDTLLAARVNGNQARVIDTAYRQLTSNLSETSDGYAVEVDGAVFPLAKIPDGFFDDYSANTVGD